MEKMIALSQSFSMGKGNLEHNLRITKGATLRQNGDKSRREWNEHIIVRGDIHQKDYEYNLLKQVIKDKIGEELAKYNEKQIQGKHIERVLTLEQWIDKKAYTRSGKKKKLICEYIVNLGNRHTACPYVQKKDSEGNLLSKSGKIIPLWDTRKSADFADRNHIEESEISKTIKPILRDFAKEFEKANPNAEIMGYSIHCDEGGAIHAHLSVLWWSKLKPLKNGKQQGVGYGIAQSEAIRQQYEKQGIKCGNTRKDNPLTMWRKDMLNLLYEVALMHGVDKLDMGNKEPHREDKAFGLYKDHYCEEMEQEYKKVDEAKAKVNKAKAILAEKEKKIADKEKIVNEKISSDIAKKEWYILKTMFPDMYKQVHEKFNKEKNLKFSKNVLDKKTNVLYNNL